MAGQNSWKPKEQHAGITNLQNSEELNGISVTPRKIRGIDPTNSGDLLNMQLEFGTYFFIYYYLKEYLFYFYHIVY